ncbi:Hypothetical predicted protein [Mytilus galloprovincialis]|uniref:CUB domain-containing protein n=2 Tax=Mytilus galloprovincialis TaxID=29158 RepID=A0A8B6G6R9_MYTGA|nr:Hypothetical predicted protein [Mytilus galloprovincialis]
MAFIFKNKRLQMSVTPTVPNIVCLICVLTLKFISPVSSQCSGSALTLTASDDLTTVTSDGYSSGSYASDLSCSWLIDSGSSAETVIVFINHYDIDASDTIDIYDGFLTSNSSLKSGLTGNGNDKEVLTTGQYALVVLTTDSSGQAQGFSLQYVKAADLSGTGCTAEQTLTATSAEQYLTSPAFPSSYTGNSNCRWLIEATEGAVYFELMLSDIETSPNCGFDYLKIYDSSYVCEHTLTVDACTRYPDGNTATYTSNGTSVLVLFVSDATVGYKGFKLKFSAVSATTTVATQTAASEDTGFALGMGVGVATGVVSTLMVIGIIQIIKSRLQASKLGSPRVRNVLPLQTPTSFGGKTPTGNGHLPNGHILRNGDIPGSQRFSVTSSISSSGNSSRNGRTPSTGHSSPNHSDTQNKNNNNYKRNGVLPTNIGHV